MIATTEQQKKINGFLHVDIPRPRDIFSRLRQNGEAKPSQYSMSFDDEPVSVRESSTVIEQLETAQNMLIDDAVSKDCNK